jgi:protein-arginine kinase
MKNYANGNDIPLGLGMALAKNLNAMNYFASLPKEKQDEIINHTHQIQSKSEMQAYVDSLIQNNFQ